MIKHVFFCPPQAKIVDIARLHNDFSFGFWRISEKIWKTIEHILKSLAEEGITSILIEGGYEVLQSFSLSDLIDQVYIYTAAHDLANASLKNPIKLTEKWTVMDEVSLGPDQLIMAEKGVECLQAL